MFFVGFAAILQVPGLKDADLALFRLSIATFPPWVVGVIGGAGVLTALVPGSMILIGAASLLANNIVREAWPRMSEDRVSLLARVLVPLLALLTVFLTLRGGTTIVQLLLMGYSLVTQLFPSLLASLMRRNPVTAPGAIAGVLVGVAAVAVLTLSRATVATLFPFLPPALQDLTVGIVALVLNIIALAVVSALTRGMAAARMQPAGE